MTTFFDLQNQIADAKFKKSVLLHLIEYLDANFRSVAGAAAAKILLTDDKLPVPPQTFEAITTDVLLAEAQAIEEDINRIMNASLAATVVETPNDGASMPATPPMPPMPDFGPLPPLPPASPMPPQVTMPEPQQIPQQPFTITVPPAPPPVLQDPAAQATAQPQQGRRRRSG